MGTYLNPGRQGFEEAVNSEIFVDKTEMVGYLNTLVNTKQKYVSVSRPRRFGKTTAADMVCAYYGRGAGSRGLFEGTRLSASAPVRTAAGELAWDAHLGAFDVVRLVMTDFLGGSESVEDMLDYLTEEVAGELMEAYPDVRYGRRINLRTMMGKVYARTGRQFVVVIDEWDAVFRQWREDAAGQVKFLDFLRDWFKDKPYIALAYMTGILPIKKYGQHSALNMFDEYSMVQPMRLAEYTGFTEAEVRDLCERYEMDFGGVSAWYDGYRLSDYVPVAKRALFREGEYNHKLSVYSPLSVVQAMRNGIVDNYWNKTETYEALAEYIRMDFDGLKSTVALLMDGGRVSVSLKAYQNDMATFHGRDDVLALLIHLGYLGFEGEESPGRIDSERGEVFIPNREVLEEFRTSTQTPEWEAPLRAFERSKELVRATWARDATRVAELLEEAHDAAANGTYNDEAALSYAVQLAYYAAQRHYTKVLELDSGKGCADVCYLPAPCRPDLPALVVELKHGHSVETAIDQIRRRNYPARLEHYRGNTLLVAVSYDRDARSGDPDFKRHTCVIEEA